MSIDLVSAALWLQLEPARKLVLIALAERADLRTGLCWPSREEIAWRASLTPRRTTPHLQALEAAGYVRSERRGSPRHGQTTLRYLAVDRILEEGKTALETYRERARQSLGDVSSPNPFQGTLLGDDDGTLGDETVIDQGTLAAPLGDAVTLTEPSDQPSNNRTVKEPSDRAIASTAGSRGRAVLQDHVAAAREKTPARTGSQDKNQGFDRLTAFARMLAHQCQPDEIATLELADEGDFVVIGGPQTAIDALRASRLVAIARAAASIGFSGVKYSGGGEAA